MAFFQTQDYREPTFLHHILSTAPKRLPALGSVRASTFIRASPQRIWDYALDFPRVPEWYPASRGVVVTKANGRGVGTTMRCAFTLRGRTYWYDQIVVEWDPPWHATVRQVHGAMIHFGATIDLSPRSGATLVSITLEYGFRFPWLLYLFYLFLVRRRVKADLRAAHANLQRIVEATTTGFGDELVAAARSAAKWPTGYDR